MNIIGGKIARYFGLRFLSAVVMVFAGIFVLVALLDYIELMRRATDVPNVSAILVAKTSLYRVPQVTERILPFCVLIGAMSCYLELFAPARAGGRARRRHVGLAVRIAGAGGGVRDRCFCDHGLQSGVRGFARAVKALRSRIVRAGCQRGLAEAAGRSG